jgi:hypothetical protein
MDFTNIVLLVGGASIASGALTFLVVSIYYTNRENRRVNSTTSSSTASTTRESLLDGGTFGDFI